MCLDDGRTSAVGCNAVQDSNGAHLGRERGRVRRRERDAMTSERLKEIVMMDSSATPGPWSRVDNENQHWGLRRVHGPAVRVGGFTIATDLTIEEGWQIESDCNFIAASRTAVPELLAHVADLTTRLAAETEARQAAERKAEELEASITEHVKRRTQARWDSADSQVEDMRLATVEHLEAREKAERERDERKEREQLLRDALGGPCPITGLRFFMVIQHPSLGWVATYGGPFDSYTTPTRDDDGGWSRERYDHDEGGWVDGCESIDVGLIVRSEEDDAELTEAAKERDALRTELATVRERLGRACHFVIKPPPSAFAKAPMTAEDPADTFDADLDRVEIGQSSSDGKFRIVGFIGHGPFAELFAPILGKDGRWHDRPEEETESFGILTGFDSSDAAFAALKSP